MLRPLRLNNIVWDISNDVWHNRDDFGGVLDKISFCFFNTRSSGPQMGDMQDALYRELRLSLGRHLFRDIKEGVME